MFRFNISEEIIFDLKNGVLTESIFDDENIFLDMLVENRVLIFHSLFDRLREKICFVLIYKIFNNIYLKDLDVNVFKVFSIEELDELYLEDKFQIFYLYDFFGEIDFISEKVYDYIQKISESDNKILIINTRKSLYDFSEYEVNLEEYSESIAKSFNLNSSFDNHDDLESIYRTFKYEDKIVLYRVFMGLKCDVNIWINTLEKYLLGRGILKDSIYFKEKIILSFKNIEDIFITFKTHNEFEIKNLLVDNFIKDVLKNDIDIIKDLVNTLTIYDDLCFISDKLESLDICLNYTLSEYENSFKNNLLSLIINNDKSNKISLLKMVLKVFRNINITDNEIIENLNMRIIYSKLNIDNAIDYFFSVKNYNKDLIIKDVIFRNKLLELLYTYETDRNFEFYMYDFKYFLFISEYCDLYGNIEVDELLDFQKRFDTLISIILNNINSYFNIEYFTLDKEIKDALIDLKFLIDRFDISFIFDKNVYEIFKLIEDKFLDLIVNVENFIVRDLNDYHKIVYFMNEFERNREFIEEVFVNINFDDILFNIKEKIIFLMHKKTNFLKLI